uniref:C-type lectin galactose-binding isoform-like n=1 Tax=Styela clava TaxID=7725 RepID=UPI001939DD1E|nr:C-type lectin galactose-binding isoform-like [Styela clava]
MEMECYENFQGQKIYETSQSNSGLPADPKQDDNKGTNKKTLIVFALFLGISFSVSVAAFILIMQLQNENKYTKEKLEKMGGTDSSLAIIINDTQKHLETSIKKEVSELNSKIYNEANKLNKSLSDTNSRITKMFSISGWFTASNNLTYKRFTDSVNYATAKAQCEGMGARLVSTGMRDNQVKNEIFPNHYLTGDRAWIGLDDISNEGIWVWSDGVNETPSTIWASGEPNGGRSDNCAEIRFYYSKIVANDASCSNAHRFVCEREFE